MNKQYRVLAREGRTDVDGVLKEQIHEMNSRWDKLSKRIAAIVRRCKHMVQVKEDFDATRQALTEWLTDMDVKLTAMENKMNTSIRPSKTLKGFKVSKYI